jgi:xylulokinase
LALLVGIDLGTGGTKAGLFDTEGNLLRLARQGYRAPSDGEPGAAEQAPQAWLEAVCATSRQVVAGISPGDLAAVCVVGQGPTLVMVDEAGQPLCDAILWSDSRPAALQQDLSARLGAPASPFAYTPQAMWLKQAHGRAYTRARWFLTAWDFVAFHLSGRAVSSCLASFEPFPAPERAASGIPEGLFPPTVAAGQVIAPLTHESARRTGLPAGLPVVAGTHDGLATLVGAGVVEMGRAADVDGTSGGLALCWNQPIDRLGVSSAAWLRPGQYIVGGAMAALGRALDWWREVVAGPGTDYDTLIEEGLNAPPGADGLIFLPYLAGERSPIWDPQARGLFFGLTQAHTRAHLTRAVLESVPFALRHLLERLIACGARVDEMRVCGGQARSMGWNQIKADVLGVPVVVPRVTEATVLGAAVLAGVGVGLLPDIADGANRMASTVARLEPDLARHRYYSDLFSIYRRLYPDLRQAFQQLSDVPLWTERAGF